MSPLQSFSRNPQAHIRTRPPVVLTSAPLLPTPSIPCIRCGRGNFPRSRVALRCEMVQVANFAGNQAENYPAATHRSPRLCPGRARTMMPVLLVVMSSGEAVRVRVEVAVMSVQLSAYDDAVRGVVALTFTVSRAVV